MVKLFDKSKKVFILIALLLGYSVALAQECKITSSDNPNITYSINPKVTYKWNPDVTYTIKIPM